MAKNNKKFDNVNDYYNNLSKPCKLAFKVGIRYALKVMRESQASKENVNCLFEVLTK